MRRKLSGMVTLFLAIGGVAYALLKDKSQNMESINDFLEHQVGKGKTPSIQYSFFDIDSVIYEFGSGFRNVKAKTAVDSETTYNLFSVTKTFTALAILQLAQEGKIQLIKPAADYLPAFPYSGQITILQLLNHTSGISNPLPLRWVHLENEHNEFDRDSFFKNIFEKNKKLRSLPGDKFRYSNLGYVLLGQIVESVSGQSYEDYIAAHITGRIRISSEELGFHISPANHAVGYHKWLSMSNAVLGFLMNKHKFMGAKEGQWQPFNNFYINGTPYGGTIGSRKGLIRYGQALLKGNSVLLNDRYRGMLFTENVIGKESTGMALSWFTGSLKGHKFYSHAGGGGGYYIELRLYPGLGVGSVVMFNRSGMTDERFLDKTDTFFITDAQDKR